ncbi:acyltransferase family protein [Embleya sp. NPDC056575]|uniref:acyltransferase family protein n=1 Tax=unclassified Embleya TaxID=2699296 RepID=UPI0036C9129D
MKIATSLHRRPDSARRRPAAGATAPGPVGPPAAPLATPASPRRLAALDGLRFLAALMVVLYHYAGYAGGIGNGAWNGKSTAVLFPTVSGIAAYGWLGVELFFLISGFVICMSSWGRTLGDFFRSRVVRLYPAYWAAVLATAVVLRLWPTVRGAPRPGDVLTNLTMLHEALGVRHVDGVYWTLWAELRFYLLFALVVGFGRGVTYRRTVLFCVTWTVAAVAVTSTGDELLESVVQPRFAPFFIGGVALYLVRRFGPDPLLWGIVGMSWLLALHSTAAEIPRQVDANHPHLSATICMGVVTAFHAVMIALALGLLDRITWSGLTTLGALTYPLYLLHENIGWTLIHSLDRPGRSAFVVLGAVTLGMIVAAWLLHRMIERPLARILNRALVRGIARMRESAPEPRRA